MNKKLQEVCRTLSESFCRLRGIDFSVNQTRPHMLPLIGQCVIENSLIAMIPPGLRIRRDEVWSSGYIQDNPVAALLAQNPIVASQREQFGALCEKVGLREALENGTWHHPTYRKLGGFLLDLCVTMCRAQGFRGDGSPSLKSDSTLLDRLRRPRRLLEAPYCEGTTIPELLQSAWKHLPRYRRVRIVVKDGKEVEEDYFRGSFLSPYIRRRRPLTLEALVLSLAKDKKKEVRQGIRAAANFDLDQMKRLPSKEEVHRPFGWETRGTTSKNWHPDVADMPYPIGTERSLGSASFYRFLKEVSKLETDAHIFWAAAAYWFCLPDSLDRIKLVHEAGRGYFVRRSIRCPQAQADPRLHRQRTDELVLPVPPRLAVAISGLLERKGGFGSTSEKALLWAADSFSVFWRGFSRALTTVGCLSFGYPWVVAHAGLYPWKPKVPAPRSYTAISHVLWPYLESYFRVVDPDYVTPPGGDPFVVGSGKVPLDGELRRYFKIWKDLLAEEPTGEDPEETASRWNAIAAGAKQAFLLGTGLRDYALPSPHIPDEGSAPFWEIYRQKSFAGTTLCPELTELMRQCERRRRQFHQRLVEDGFRPMASEVPGPFSMFQVDWKGMSFTYVAARAKDVMMAHFISPSLRPFAGFCPGMIRHYTATKLREWGCPEMEARAYLGHQARALSPFSAFRLELAIPRRRRDQLAQRLGKEVGLWN